MEHFILIIIALLLLVVVSTIHNIEINPSEYDDNTDDMPDSHL